MKRPRSLRRLLHPQDHRSLEDIALHAQLGVLRAQPLELLDVAAGQPLGALAGLPRLGDPVAQGPLVDPQVPATWAIGFPVSSMIRTAPSRNSRSYFLRISGIATPYSRCLHDLGGTSVRLSDEVIGDRHREVTATLKDELYYRQAFATRVRARFAV